MKQAKKSDTKIVAHARRELEMANLFTPNKENDYDGFIGKGSLALVKLFDDWTHDDVAKMQAVHSVFNYLIAGDLLSPPTNDPSEWEDVVVEGKTVTRNLRNNMYITRDSRRTWFNLRTEQRGICTDIKTGQPLEGVKDPNGKPEQTAKNQEGPADAGDAGHGADAERSAPAKEGSTGGSDTSGVEEAKLDAGVEPKGKTDTAKKKAPAKKSQSGEK